MRYWLPAICGPACRHKMGLEAMAGSKLDLFSKVFGGKDFQVFLSIFRSYFPLYRYKYGAIILLIVVSSNATAAAAWLVRDVVNGFFVKKDGQFLIPLFLAIVGLFIAKGAASYWQSVMSARIANSMVARTQARIFAHILKQRVRFFEQYSSDDLNMRVNMGAAAVGSILNQVILNGARDGVTVISLLAVMAGQDIALTLICLVAVPFVFLGITLLLKHIKELMQQEMLSIIELNKHVREAVQGIRVIKAYNLEPVITCEVNNVIGSIKDRSNRVAALQTAPIPIIDTIGGIGIGLVILYAGYRSIYDTYDPGTFLSFITALLLGLDPARRLSQLRVSLRTSLIAVGMVDSLLKDNDPEMQGPAVVNCVPRSELSHGLGISLHGVHFGYSRHGDVLRDFTLDIRAGETVAFVGPSGAGKSTLFSLLLQFHHQQSGQILIGGTPVERIPVFELRNLISYVGQSNFIFSGTMRDNLTLRNPNVTQEALDEACRVVGLSSYIASLPKGYDTDVGELGALISGGQAQRINIVRAIIKDAPILLFDEVTSALDADNEELIRAYMQAQAGRKTILVIAHRISTVRQADKIVLIEDGAVQAFGTHQELMRKNLYYERVANLQLVA
jgi:ATP-binding cassette, subfamily B, bacterial MsbA